MKYILFVFGYMFISGLFGGLAHNGHHERCKTIGTPGTEQIVDALLWPVAIGIVVTMDDDKYLIGECKGKKSN